MKQENGPSLWVCIGAAFLTMLLHVAAWYLTTLVVLWWYKLIGFDYVTLAHPDGQIRNWVLYVGLPSGLIASATILVGLLLVRGRR